MTASTGEIVLTRRGLYMLPTRQGWTFALTLVVLLLAAINYGNSLAYGLTFLLAAIAVISMLVTDRNLLYLRVRAGVASAVFAGQAAEFRVHLVNPGARARYGVVLAHDRREIARADLAPFGSATVAVRVATQQRGWLTPPPIYATTRFPLGILYSWSRRFALTQRCLVYPKPSEPWPWHAYTEATDWLNASPRMGGDDFSGVREYRPGDSPRQIDWKSAARGRGLMTKEFTSGVSANLWFDLARVPAPDLETRLGMLCRAVIDAEQAGLRYGLRLDARAIAPGGGEGHERGCLRALALYGMGDEH